MELVKELTNVGGAFYNKLNGRLVNFNLIDNVQIHNRKKRCLKIKLAEFGKIFFYKKALTKYIKESTPPALSAKYSGHTQIDNAAVKLNGLKRKKIFELLSQFKYTGFCRISVTNFKTYLGYIEIINKSSRIPLVLGKQYELFFIPEDSFELIDHSPPTNKLIQRIVKPAIQEINALGNSEINNVLFNSEKSGRCISNFVFTYNALGRNLMEDEDKAISFFINFGLDRGQIIYLLKIIGYKEMYGRYMKSLDRKVIPPNQEASYFAKGTNIHINNLLLFFETDIFPELKHHPKFSSTCMILSFLP